MKKIFIVGLITILSSTSFGQDRELDSLMFKKQDYVNHGWCRLGMSMFSYTIASTGFINPWSDPNTRGHVYTNGSIGLTFNVLAIVSFVKARKIQKQINRCSNF